MARNATLRPELSALQRNLSELDSLVSESDQSEPLPPLIAAVDALVSAHAHADRHGDMHLCAYIAQALVYAGERLAHVIQDDEALMSEIAQTPTRP